MENKNVIRQDYRVKKEDRFQQMGHKPLVIWFTGLSGSGKSTLANLLEQKLVKEGYHTYTLDGDNIRRGINRDLGFSEDDRTENIRRIGEVAKLFVDAGLIVLSAFISPFKADRDNARNLVGAHEFLEVFVDCPLEVCESRDVKGLYKKARDGKIQDFTGISSPFEAPEHPDVHIPTDKLSLEESAERIFKAVQSKIAL